jgi:hypothetical protein
MFPQRRLAALAIDLRRRALSSAPRRFRTSKTLLPVRGQPGAGTRCGSFLFSNFAGESMANRRYTYFAAQADVQASPARDL